MMIKYSSLCCAAILLLAGCKTPSEAITHNSTSRSITSLDYSMNALLWQQRSGEYRALCYQAFSTARTELQKLIDANKDGMPLAIVTDIDETVLDNSPQQAYDLLHKTTYTEQSWLNWTSKANAKALPDAAKFFRFADSNKVACFYISNRRPVEKNNSIRNLQLQGFPQADSMHVMMKDESSDKEARRIMVGKQYKIVMLLGDNLNDFDKMFYQKNADTRVNLVDRNAGLFGTKFIILPNPLYGDWESAIWNAEKITPAEADKRKHEALISY